MWEREAVFLTFCNCEVIKNFILNLVVFFKYFFKYFFFFLFTLSIQMPSFCLNPFILLYGRFTVKRINWLWLCFTQANVIQHAKEHTFASLHKIFGIFLWYQLHACALLAAAPKGDKTLDTRDKRVKKGVNETDTRIGIIFSRQLDVFIICIIIAFLIEQSVTKFPDYYASTLTIWPCHNFHRTAILWKTKCTCNVFI